MSVPPSWCDFVLAQMEQVARIRMKAKSKDWTIEALFKTDELK